VVELDRVLDGDDVRLAVRVDVVDHRRQGRGLAAAGRTGDQDQPVVQGRHGLQGGWQPQVVQGGHLGAQHSEGRAEVAAFLEGIDAEARRPVGVGKVDFAPGRQLPPLGGAHRRMDEALGILGRQHLVADGNQLAVQAHRGRGSHLQVQVGGLMLDHHRQKVVQFETQFRLAGLLTVDLRLEPPAVQGLSDPPHPLVQLDDQAGGQVDPLQLTLDAGRRLVDPVLQSLEDGLGALETFLEA